MKQIFYFLLSIPLFASNINDYLIKNENKLWSYYHQVKKQSIRGDYPIFRQNLLIDQRSYEQLPKDKRRIFHNHLVFIAFYLRSKPVYSDFGGVSIKGRIAEETGGLGARDYFYLFDGRYYTDLMNVDRDKRIYAYCRLPNFNSCILLGIGEEW
ncbi:MULTISPECIES: hypothetical protein [unclassified Helicobacter]|uniref:hypothetical protein n=1 Tax=unclassified Helicobacter TaxID=2593540 RepID=UPI000CF0445C|nr:MULTISPECIES: hypothetical protein [unclassified Helicobacter]